MKMDRQFYQGSALEVGKNILGLSLVHKSKEGITKGKIVEVEAYMGSADKAAHSYSNKKTSRTEIQYQEGGYAYIYLIYGMHYCMNIVCNQIEIPEVVLIRALEPIEGIEIMKKRRNTDKLMNLCSGPGKLCAAMGIGKEQYGLDLCGDELYIEKPNDFLGKFEIDVSKRINIDYSGEAKDFEWRYTIRDNKFISNYKTTR